MSCWNNLIILVNHSLNMFTLIGLGVGAAGAIALRPGGVVSAIAIIGIPMLWVLIDEQKISTTIDRRSHVLQLELPVVAEQLGILIETMRRDGYEFNVSRPEIIVREIDGEKCEPVEDVVIEVPENFAGAVLEKLPVRKGRLLTMEKRGEQVVMQFVVPSRGLFGYRNEFLTDTRGEGVLRDDAAGLRYLEGAARSGSPQAAFMVGALYETGQRGVRADMDEAKRWYAAAANLGSEEARLRLARFAKEASPPPP